MPHHLSIVTAVLCVLVLPVLALAQPKPQQDKENLYTHVVDPVVEETRQSADAESRVFPSRYAVAEDIVRIHEDQRRAIENAVPEAIIGDDDRYPITNSAVYAHSRRTCHITATVGNRTHGGTGAFISPRLVLTAAHVVRPTGTAPDRIRVIPGAYRTDGGTGRVVFPYGEQSTTETRIHPMYVHSDAHRSRYDIGVVVLPNDALYRRIGERFGLMVATNELLDRYKRGSRHSYTFSPLGYPGDKEIYSMWGHPLSHVLSYDSLTIRTDADVVPGVSGAAVVHGWGRLSGHIFGVVVAESPNYNVIKRIDDDTFSQIQEWMDEFE